MRRFDVEGDDPRGFDLTQSRLEISLIPRYPCERIPSAVTDRVRVSMAGLFRDFRRYARMGSADRLPVAEIPCLQFLDRDAIEHLPRLSPGLRACMRIRIGRRPFESRFALRVVVVAIKHDNEPAAGG